MATPIRAVRIPEDVWQLAKRRSIEQGTTVSAVIVRALTEFGCDHDVSETMLRDEVFVETCSDCGVTLSQYRLTKELREASEKGPWPLR